MSGSVKYVTSVWRPSASFLSMMYTSFMPIAMSRSTACFATALNGSYSVGLPRPLLALMNVRKPVNSVSWYARLADLNCAIGPSLLPCPNEVIAWPRFT